MLKPKLMIPRAWEHFDAEGRLTNEALRQRVRAHIEALIAWTHQVRPH